MLSRNDSLQIPVKISKYEANYVRLELDAASSGVVVLKDAFFPGWRAFVDGKETPVRLANGMVRGVLIDGPGQYVVEFRYLPRSFVNGVISSALILFVLLLSLCFKRKKSVT